MRLEINNNNKNINEVLVDIPFGKQYISDESPVDQSAQKEGTCWYYTFNYMRVHYGKAIPSDHPARKIEKAVSMHRKRMTDIDERASLYRNYLLKKFKEKENITRMEVKKFLDDFKKDEIEQYLLGKKKRIEVNKILNDFLAQEKIIPLKSFIDDTIMRLEIKSIEILLDELKADYPSRQPGQPVEEYKNNLNGFLKMELATQYGLVFSSWEPNQGITGLIEALRTQGSCYVSSYCGTPFYKNEAHELNEKFGKRKVYGWNKGEYFKTEDNNAGHAILLVGARKKGDQEYVYFIDPNDSNKINGENKIYKVSYNRFFSTLRNFVGYALNTYKGSYGPFLCHANPHVVLRKSAHIDEIKKSLKTYSKKLTPASLTMFKSKPAFETTPADLAHIGGSSTFDSDLDSENLTPATLMMFVHKDANDNEITSVNPEKNRKIETKLDYSQLSPSSLTLFQYKKASELSPADLIHNGSQLDLANIGPTEQNLRNSSVSCT